VEIQINHKRREFGVSLLKEWNDNPLTALYDFEILNQIADYLDIELNENWEVYTEISMMSYIE